MAIAAVLATQLEVLLNAKGWNAIARRFTISAEEPALDPVSHTWMAGDARGLSTGEVLQVRPSRIIVQDAAPLEEIERLGAAMQQYGAGSQVYTVTRFIDMLWDANQAAQRAVNDARTSDADNGFEFHIPDPDARHIEQQVRFDDQLIVDHRVLEFGLPFDSSCLAILADAGLGKSELLKWHEWRYGVMYLSAWSQHVKSLPPVAVRIPLRDVRSLSLDSIAHYLSHPEQEGGLQSLRQIETGRFLLELMRAKRIVLLLDGLDELPHDASKLDEGLLELRRIASLGAQFVLTARAGHAVSRGSIIHRFDASEIGRIEPMQSAVARELLIKYGADGAHADQILAALGDSAARGIPLFLLLAYQVNLSEPLDADVRESRTRVLLQLLHLFCLRDEGRLGLSPDEQMDFLTSISEWLLVEGPLKQDELMTTLGLDPADPATAILRSPHALLTLGKHGSVEFRHPQFFALFGAKALAQSWADYGFASIVGTLGTRELDDSSLDYLARLVSPELIAGAWASTRGNVARPNLLVRRNILGLALSTVSDLDSGGDPRARAETLAGTLGDRTVDDVSLAGLFLERFDFSGWTFARIHGRRGTLRYCRNLDLATADKSVATITELEGCSFEQDSAKAVDLTKGLERLRRLVRPLRRKNGGGIIAIMSVEEAKDPEAWATLVRQGLASRQGKAGTSRWVLAPDGLKVVATLAASVNADAERLDRVISEDQQLRTLLEELSA